jgi:hypothetical protein
MVYHPDSHVSLCVVPQPDLTTALSLAGKISCPEIPRVDGPGKWSWGNWEETMMQAWQGISNPGHRGGAS